MDYILETYLGITEGFIFAPYLWVRKPENYPNTANRTKSFHEHYNLKLNFIHHILKFILSNINVLLQIQIKTNIKCNAINKNIFEKSYKINKNLQKH